MLIVLSQAVAAPPAELRAARDRQDRPALEKAIAALAAQSEKKPADAEAQYVLALAQSYLAEICLELRLRNEARAAAEKGIQAAEKATQLKPQQAEYHRILGTLCGQVIPANVLAGLKYGKCAMESVNKALQLDAKSSMGWLSKGVGNYYLPPSFGGGVDLAIKDMEKAISLDPKSSDAYVWLGTALRKKNLNAEARKALEKALELNPQRIWAKQLLEKTPQ
ncbi:MAG: tetratricopeptide repeat protein [Bryobacterales bacterium]|nr:tetratricopeptide repeat protein [Bryobacterales bacterium]